MSEPERFEVRVVEEKATSIQLSTVSGIKDDSDLKEPALLDKLLADSSLMNDLKKSDFTIDPNGIDDPQLKERVNSDQQSAVSSCALSFVAYHMNVIFNDDPAINQYKYDVKEPPAPPVAKSEQGHIMFTLTKTSAIDSVGIFSPFHTIANLPWRLCAKAECSNRTDLKKYLCVFIHCNQACESNLWSCEAEIKFVLHSNRPKGKSYVQCFTKIFDSVSCNWGYPTFMQWSDFVDPQKGYVNNDEATIQVQVSIKKLVGVRVRSNYDFMSNNLRGSSNNAVLIVEGKELSICKYYLTIYSPVFREMFFSHPIERDEIIILDGVVLDEFLELMHVIYPSRKPVSNTNVEYLLKLGKRFEIQYVIDECEEFLVGTDQVTIAKKMIWADQYCFANLQDECIKTFKNCLQVKALKENVEYKAFTSETKVALLERMFKVM